MHHFILRSFPLIVICLTTASAQEISSTHKDVAYDVGVTSELIVVKGAGHGAAGARGAEFVKRVETFVHQVFTLTP